MATYVFVQLINSSLSMSVSCRSGTRRIDTDRCFQGLLLDNKLHNRLFAVVIYCVAHTP